MAEEREEFVQEADAVCWLDRLCDSCGAFVEASESGACWNCGFPPGSETQAAADSMSCESTIV
jgi:hypothetical protein